MKILRTSFLLVFTAYILCACNTTDLYEKTSVIPGHSWKNSFKPSFSFAIKDTAASYQFFLVLRHNDKYSFNNIWLNLSVQTPGNPGVKTFRVDAKLATDDKGWHATGMDDIYEHQVELNEELVANEISFRKPGTYTFTLEQTMREDPLNNVLNVGLRIEKKK